MIINSSLGHSHDETFVTEVKKASRKLKILEQQTLVCSGKPISHGTLYCRTKESRKLVDIQGQLPQLTKTTNPQAVDYKEWT